MPCWRAEMNEGVALGDETRAILALADILQAPRVGINRRQRVPLQPRMRLRYVHEMRVQQASKRIQSSPHVPNHGEDLREILVICAINKKKRPLARPLVV